MNFAARTGWDETRRDGTQEGGLPMKRRNKGVAGQATRVVALSFGGVILVGALLLMLPISSADGTCCGALRAFFTATSASCVTGLVLADTLTAWSPFGQAVILGMIQLGGLGFMTIIYLLSSVIRKRSSISQRLLMVSAFNLNDLSDAAHVVRGALRITFTLEGAGAAILAACFAPRYGWGAVWKGIFVSVSAFCNAGFDILGPEGLGSLSGYNANPVVLLTAAALVICGGLGFFVWEELRTRRSYRRLSLYSKMVLWITGALLLGGTVFFFCTEYANPATLGPMPVWQKLLNAFFQSASLRTAGFYAIDQGALTDTAMAGSILLMLVGGSSGSTAGGLKTVTLGVLLLSMGAGLRGRETVVFRGRQIPQKQVLSALTLVQTMGFVFLTASMAIALADSVPFLQAAYEAASAIATVGLTTGITPGLSLFSHLLLIAMMYLGRVGVLSFSLAFLSGGTAERIQYPETSVMIG